MNKLDEVQISNNSKNNSWGAIYWQYFEELDNVQVFEETPLVIEKRLSRISINDEGEQAYTIDDSVVLNPGDRVRTRIELSVDRPMEFVVLKDMRGSGTEPVNVLSGYRWQDGLSYYESTEDVASYFYIDFLPKGNFVFEYDVFVIHKGSYSSGISNIQSVYAPEFSSHSSSIKLLSQTE